MIRCALGNTAGTRTHARTHARMHAHTHTGACMHAIGMAIYQTGRLTASSDSISANRHFASASSATQVIKSFRNYREVQDRRSREECHSSHRDGEKTQHYRLPLYIAHRCGKRMAVASCREPVHWFTDFTACRCW